MKKFYIFLILIVFFASQKGFSQNRIYVCFEEGSSYIEIKFNEDSTLTNFSIVKPNYETESSKERALKEYRETALETGLGPPNFYVFYYSMKKPVKLNSMENIDCKNLVDLKEYRYSGFKRPPNVSGASIIFIQKISGNKFLKWEVVKSIVKNTRE